MLIATKRSIIPACDVRTLGALAEIATAGAQVEGVGALKVGLTLVGRYGLFQVREVVEQAKFCGPIIYDHQKGGTDIPDLGTEFAEMLKDCRIPAAILFPFGGVNTQEDWIKACQDAEITVLVGGHMTHKGFLTTEGGYIAPEAPTLIYQRAAGWGVRDFVVPGNKPELVAKYRGVIEEVLGPDKAVFYAPGFIAQGGVISDAAKAAGDQFHGIVGRAITGAKDKVAALKELTSQLDLPTCLPCDGGPGQSGESDPGNDALAGITVPKNRPQF